MSSLHLEKISCKIDFSKGKNASFRTTKTLTILSQKNVDNAISDLSKDGITASDDLINLFCCGEVSPNEFFDSISDWKIVIIGRKISEKFDDADFYIPVFYFKFKESLVPLFLYYEYQDDVKQIKTILDSHLIFLTMTSNDLYSFEYISTNNTSQMAGFLMGSFQYLTLT